jgi:glycosyltransferase involved in cell wall biosynthesis
VLGGLRIGGYEILSARIANALVVQNSEVAILSLSDDSQIAGSVEPRVEKIIARRYFKYDVLFIFRVSKALCDFNPDIVVCCAFYPYFVVRLASLFCKKAMRFILAFHVTKPFDRKDDRWNYIYSKCARLFRDNYVAIHASQVDFYNERYGLPRNRFTVIHNAVDTKYFAHDNSERKNKAFRIAHVAGLKPLKDQWTLLRAVIELNKRRKNWELIVAGEDNHGMLQQYEHFAERAHLSSKVRFALTLTDVRGLLNSADVFVLTSLTEALPISVIEAISMGLPCIVTDVGGNTDIIEHGKEGFLVRPRDFLTIAGYLQFLMDNKAKRMEMSIAARRKAIRNFDFGNMIRKYLMLFDRVISS